MRSGDLPQTTLDYTGQQRDNTGLLYYNARYYDPALGKFLSPDTIVPGVASGAGGGAATLGYDERVALGPLTVDFHEPGFLAGLNAEMAAIAGGGFFDGDRKPRTGPANPQALNRYAYVLNNPVRYVDPTGHDTCAGVGCGGVVRNNSKKPIRVIGSAYVGKDESSVDKSQGAWKCNDSGCYQEGFIVILQPGQSSLDFNMADVDSIVEGEDGDSYQTYKVGEHHDITVNEGGVYQERWKDPVTGPLSEAGFQIKLRLDCTNAGVAHCPTMNAGDFRHQRWEKTRSRPYPPTTTGAEP